MNKRSSILLALFLSSCVLALSACAGKGAARAAAQAPSRGAPGANADKVHAERIQVSFGDVKKLASVLRDVLDMEGPRQGPIRAILVDEPTGDLVIIGTDEGIASARRLISPACDLRPEKGVEVEVVPLSHAAAADVVHVVRSTTGPGAKVIADAPTNSVIIQALAEERERLRRVIAALDVEPKTP